jgi:F0F1-type ATP synthase assembly protein I
MEWQKYIIPFAAGVAAGARFVETRLAGAFTAGVFIVTWDPWVIVGFVLGMVVGQFIMARRAGE